jgi:hypothetical protein
LITCGGFDRATAKYEDDVVVSADLTTECPVRAVK